MTVMPDIETTSQWRSLDSAHYLHPFTDYARLNATGARIIERGEGVYLYDTDGNSIIDGLAGLGCVTVGYGNKDLARVAAEQIEKLSYCQSFFATSHPSAIALARKLCEILGRGLEHVFFASSGSEANETNLKLAWRYWALLGRPDKKLILARENSYHGSTIATSSLCGIPPFHTSGGDLPIPNIHHIGAPYHYLNGADEGEEEFGIRAASWLEDAILAAGANNVAAFFAEPFQGAGGVIIPPMTYWAEIQRICSKYDVLLIVDEVVSGFGRTGSWFGSDHFAIAKPDMVTLAKGITSGYVPLSAAMIGEKVADTLMAKGGEWYHGFTYSGHPVACAVALENIRLLEDGIMDHATSLVDAFGTYVASLGDHPLVGNARSCGLIGGMQLVSDKSDRTLFDPADEIGQMCSDIASRNGLAFRAIGDTMALMPPLIITAGQLATVFDIARGALDETATILRKRGWHG